ncbi:hypothetical protein [Stenotrophomonas sp. SORGH_AS_0321]|uniref:hypothetical protein n=1 Tax=Stenotrophomonas sp. SORGH_AS_0321 TaxID=3041787 RepID=UPI00286A48EA|nr:hypothetical protein [Stenotrophomonas sp. SORGH_AS_0321]
MSLIAMTPTPPDIGAIRVFASQRRPSAEMLSLIAHCSDAGESAAIAAPAGRAMATAMAEARRVRLFLPREAVSSEATAQVPVDTLKINL